MPDINSQRLREIYNTDSCARAFLSHASQRSRNQTSTTVDRALTNLENAGHEFTRQQLIDVFRVLEECGCGIFRVGRRGWPSRFAWSSSMIDVGKAASGVAVQIHPLDEGDAEGTEDATDWLSHTYHLRPGVEISVELPMDLSPAEAERISTFVRTLPFDQEP